MKDTNQNERPAALLSDVSARLWSSGNSNNDSDDESTNDGETNTTSSAGISENNPSAFVSKKKRFSYPATLLERFSHRNSGATSTTTTTTTSTTTTAGAGSTHHHHSKDAVPHISIAPTSHRENTAIHALKDTFYFPSPWSLLPALPTIPCMSGLGQSNLFTDAPSLNTTYYPGDIESPHEHSRNASSSSRQRRSFNEDENVTHHQKAGALFTSGNKHDSFKKLEGLNVLMLGGYRGSILRDANTGRRLWVPLKVGFNVRKAELAIGLTREDELRTTENVVPGKSLAAIAGFVDLGKRLKDKLKQMDKDGQIHFHSWGYDWRRSLDLSSAELVTYLEKAKLETGKPTVVIAHSMGGLVALHALARAADPTIFKGIIFGSTPFDGTPNILQPFKHGDSILMNKDICSPSTVFSFRSSFYLLPPNKTCFYNAEGKLHPVDFFDAKEWIKYGLSPMTLRLGESSPQRHVARHDATQADAPGGVAPIAVQQLGDTNETTYETSGSENANDEEPNDSDEVIRTYLEQTLANVKLFREELSSFYDPSKMKDYPPVVLISSRKTATVKGCLVNNELEIIDGDYDRLLFGEGDGIILHESASALPKVWQQHQVGQIESSNGHVSILSDLGSIRQAIDLISVKSSTPM